MTEWEELIKDRLKETIEIKQNILNDEGLRKDILSAAERMISVLKAGGKIVLCGNGGSASDAMHFAGELVGRFQKERASLPALVLNSDPVAMSSIANDFDYDEVFSRQIDAFVHKEDMLVGISTSGNSENVLRAVKAAGEKGAVTIGLLGNSGGRIGKETDLSVIVPSDIAARVQESHIVILHIFCELIEDALFSK